MLFNKLICCKIIYREEDEEEKRIYGWEKRRKELTQVMERTEEETGNDHLLIMKDFYTKNIK